MLLPHGPPDVCQHNSYGSMLQLSALFCRDVMCTVDNLSSARCCICPYSETMAVSLQSANRCTVGSLTSEEPPKKSVVKDLQHIIVFQVTSSHLSQRCINCKCWCNNVKLPITQTMPASLLRSAHPFFLVTFRRDHARIAIKHPRSAQSLTEYCSRPFRVRSFIVDKHVSTLG